MYGIFSLPIPIAGPRKGKKHYAGCFTEQSSAEHRARELWREHGAPLETPQSVAVPRRQMGQMF
jgi:hypothetical protein